MPAAYLAVPICLSRKVYRHVYIVIGRANCKLVTKANKIAKVANIPKTTKTAKITATLELKIK